MLGQNECADPCHAFSVSSAQSSVREKVADVTVAGCVLEPGGRSAPVAQPCLPKWEATGGPSPEPGEGSDCQAHFEWMVTGPLVAALRLTGTRLCPCRGTHNDVTFTQERLNVAGALEIGSQRQLCK